MISDEALKEISRMLNGFPQTTGNYTVLLDTYERDLDGVSDDAVISAAIRFRRGEVPEQSKKFAPALPEFLDEVRRREDVIAIRSRPRIAAPSYVPGPIAPFQIAQQKALADNSHLPVLFEDINFDQFKKLSAMKQIPTGSKWVSALGIIYGPAPKSHSIAA